MITIDNPPLQITRRDFFAIQFAIRLMRTVEVAPGKLAVPRNQKGPTIQIDCQMGIAVQMADDLGRMLDAPAPPPAPEVTEPEKSQEPPAAN